MNELSRLSDMAEILGALFVIGGVFFAVAQMRQYRQQRRELAAIELFRFFGNPEFADAYYRILKLPDGLSAKEMRNNKDDIEGCAMLISTTMENIGVMVYHRIVPFVVVNNLLGTTTVILWRQLEHWIRELRVELEHPAKFEWFEWHANMLESLSDDDHLPAFEAHKDWRPKRRSNEI